MNWSWLGLFGAGLTTFLSPCVLPLVPVLVATWVTPGASASARVRSTLWFATGFVVTFVALGAGAATLSSALMTIKPLLLFVGAAVLGLFSFRMLGVIKPTGIFSWLERSVYLPDPTSKVPRGLKGLLFGMVFGLSWTPCVGPILGAVLTYVASQQSSALKGAAMLFAFSLGIAVPLIVVAAALDHLRPALGRLRSWLPKIEYATGVALLIFAVSLFNQARLSTSSLVTGSGVTAEDQNHQLVTLGKNDAHQIRMVFFYSTHCPVCHAMESFLPSFEKDCSSKGFQFSKVNVDLPQNAVAAEHFGVRAVPTISVLNDAGAEIIHLVGYQAESSLRTAARSTVGLLCENSNDDKKVKPPFDTNSTGAACVVGQQC